MIVNISCKSSTVQAERKDQNWISAITSELQCIFCSIIHLIIIPSTQHCKLLTRRRVSKKSGSHIQYIKGSPNPLKICCSSDYHTIYSVNFLILMNWDTYFWFVIRHPSAQGSATTTGLTLGSTPMVRGPWTPTLLALLVIQLWIQGLVGGVLGVRSHLLFIYFCPAHISLDQSL